MASTVCKQVAYLSKQGSSSSSPFCRRTSATVVPVAMLASAPSLPSSLLLAQLRVPIPGSDSRARSSATASSAVPTETSADVAQLVSDAWLPRLVRRRARRPSGL